MRPKFRELRSASIARSQMWLGLPVGRFHLGGTCRIAAARARWWSFVLNTSTFYLFSSSVNCCSLWNGVEIWIVYHLCYWYLLEIHRLLMFVQLISRCTLEFDKRQTMEVPSSFLSRTARRLVLCCMVAKCFLTVCRSYITDFSFWCNIYSLEPSTHWQQSRIQHGRLCWKSTASLWPRIHWRHSRPYRHQSPPRQAVEFKLLPICCQNQQQSWPYLQQSWPYRQQSTLLPICRRFPQQTTFNKVDRVEFNFVASVYWALGSVCCCCKMLAHYQEVRLLGCHANRLLMDEWCCLCMTVRWFTYSHTTFARGFSWLSTRFICETTPYTAVLLPV